MEKTIYTLLATLLWLLCSGLNAQAQSSVCDDGPQAQGEPNYRLQVFTSREWNASNFASPKDLEWFREARFGTLISFGLSRGQEISWGYCHTRKPPDRGEGPVPDEVWTQWPKEMKLERFNAREWVSIARQAGLNYVVVIAKHHDGFHMWDTAFSDFKITNTPFGRDYLKEVADACHEAHMPFGIYYSQRDWYHPDYAPVDPRSKPGESRRPGPSHRKYIDYQFKVVRELCTKYGKVDIFWFDAHYWGGMFRAEDWDSERLTRLVRELQPGILINNRASLPGDFDTPEQIVGKFQNTRPWESAITLSRSWAWSDAPAKSEADVIRTIVGCATGDGNLLLGLGPRPDGSFDPSHIARLKEVGDWLKRYGGSIYGTRGGPFLNGAWGGSTYKGKTVWLHILGWGDGSLKLGPLAQKITGARVLTGGKATYRQSADGVDVDLAKEQRDPVDTIIEIRLDRPVVEGQKLAAIRPNP